MTQDERWQQQYEQFMAFMHEHHRRPSKHHIEEHLMLNWFKHNKKMMAKGLLPDYRIEKFEKLLEEADSLRRKNQYEYVRDPTPAPPLEGRGAATAKE